jgi:hypothetical protein
MNRAFLLPLFFLALACGEADPKDGDPSDTQETGQVDTGPDPYEGCALNSGYPCTCEAGIETCDDGNPCVLSEGNTSFGVCSMPCDGMAENAMCDQANTDSWGAAAACIFTAGGTIGQGMGEGCGVLCLWKGEEGECPPGQECVPTWMSGADICLPPG